MLRLRNASSRPAVLFLLLAVLAAGAARAASCPANGVQLPTAAERQAIVPIVLLRCFLPADEIDVIIGSIGRDPQSSSIHPLDDSGKLNPDGSLRPALTATELSALVDMHTILDQDMSAGAITRKFVPNGDVGGFLYGRTVISSQGSLVVVSTNTVRGFVGLERNTLGLDAGQAIAALGLDYETAPRGQFTDAIAGSTYRRQVAIEIQEHGLHSIRHIMSAQGASQAEVPLGQDLNAAAAATAPALAGRTVQMNRQGQFNPYNGLGISDDIGLMVLQRAEEEYPLHLNEEDTMVTPTPLAAGDMLIRRSLDGDETRIAVYAEVTADDGSSANAWQLSPDLSAAEVAYYQKLIDEAAARVANAGG
jgi:hypothetical protein